MSRRSAFTIIEVLATLNILLFGILTAFTAITYGARAGSDGINRTMAAHLATEGLEIVRNIRDKNWIAGQPYDTSLSPGSYLVFYGSPALTPSLLAAGGSPYPLDINQTTGLYGYDSSRWIGSGFTGAPSRFTRVVTISEPTDSGAGTDYLRVTSQVSWRASDGMRTVTLDTHLYDWRP